jgi:transposase
VNCPEHGVRQVRVSWAETKARFTALFERFAIDVVLETSITGAATILKITWDEAHHIMERAVARAIARRPHGVPKKLSIDEKSLAKGQRYATMVCDSIAATSSSSPRIGPRKACAAAWAVTPSANCPPSRRSRWTCGSLRPATARCRRRCGRLDRLDRFHIVGHMNDALDQVRRRENKPLRADGDDRLVGSKHLWLYAAENLASSGANLETKLTFAQLRSSNLKTARAWALKESLRALWKQPSRAAGERWYKRWYSWAVRSRLTPVKKVAAMVKRHLQNVLTYFKHRITNAGSEAINSVVQMLKK